MTFLILIAALLIFAVWTRPNIDIIENGTVWVIHYTNIKRERKELIWHVH